jgi:hypothetical protein
MGIMIKVVDAISVEKACAPDQPVDFVALLKQKLGKIGSVLSCNSGDQRSFRNFCQPSRLSIATLSWNLRSTNQLVSSDEREATIQNPGKATIPLRVFPMTTMETIDHVSVDHGSSSAKLPGKEEAWLPTPLTNRVE